MSSGGSGRAGDPADLAIVGGGPAGLATAIEARLAGLSVAVLDRRRPPLDKACGEGLMPDAVSRLAALGVEVAGRPFRGIRYLDGATAAEGTFPGPPGMGVRRTALHAALVRRAEEVGVALRWGAHPRRNAGPVPAPGDAAPARRFSLSGGRRGGDAPA